MATVTSSRGGSGLADVVGLILDKGIVIDAKVAVGILGIRILEVEARVVISSVETYLGYAAALGLTSAPVAAPVVLPATTARWLPPSSTSRVLPASPIPVPVEEAPTPDGAAVVVDAPKAAVPSDNEER